jgi:hypothetical protein
VTNKGEIGAWVVSRRGRVRTEIRSGTDDEERFRGYRRRAMWPPPIGPWKGA